MGWYWRATLASNAVSDPVPDRTFATQAAAETWLTSTYAELADQGVRAVSLYEEDRLVYGPMSLDAG